MTYVIGWKSKSRVFICGDSIGTSPKSESANEFVSYKESSFGEAFYSDDSIFTTEAYIKVLNVNDKVIIGFSGNVGVSYEVITYFQRLLEFHNDYSGESIKKVFLEAIRSSDDDENVHKASFIFGFKDQDKAILLSYNRRGNRKLMEHDELVEIGSLSDNKTYSSITKQLHEHVQAINEEDQLTVFCALLQSYGFQERSIMDKYGVGGAIFGVQVDRSRVSWLDDTVYLIYFEEFKTVRIVTLFVRENVIFLKFNSNRLILSEGDFPNNWKVHSPNDLFESLMPGLYKNIVFLSAKYRKVTILKTNDFNHKSKYANIGNPNSKFPDFYLTQQFLRQLLDYSKLQKMSNDYLAFELGFINDEPISVPNNPGIFFHLDFTNGVDGYAVFEGKQWMHEDFDSTEIKNCFGWFGEIQLLPQKTPGQKFIYQIGSSNAQDFLFSVVINEKMQLGFHVKCNETQSLSVEISDTNGINPFDSFFALGCVFSIYDNTCRLDLYLNNQVKCSKTLVTRNISLNIDRQVIGGDLSGASNAIYNLKEYFLINNCSDQLVKDVILYFDRTYRKQFFYPKSGAGKL